MQAMQAALDAMPVRRKLQRSNSYDRDVHDAALALVTLLGLGLGLGYLLIWWVRGWPD